MLTIISIVLYIQLVSEIGRQLVGFKGSLLCSGIIVLSNHEFGNLPEYHVFIEGE